MLYNFKIMFIYLKLDARFLGRASVTFYFAAVYPFFFSALDFRICPTDFNQIFTKISETEIIR